MTPRPQHWVGQNKQRQRKDAKGENRMANADLWKRAKEKHEQKKKEDEDRRGVWNSLYSKPMSEKHSTKGYAG